MLVLKRKTLEAAIAKLEKQIADDKSTVSKRLTDLQDKFITAYERNLELTQKALDTEAAKFKKLVKERKQIATDEFTHKLDALTDAFGQGSLQVVPYTCRYGVEEKPIERERQLASLKGILALVDGAEVTLSNTLAEKFLGKMDIVGLLS